MAARRAANALLTVTLAPRCAGCPAVLEAPLAGPVCAACWAAVGPVTPPACRVCGQPLPSWRTISVETERCAACRRRPPVFARGAVVGLYDGPLRAILHAFKYDGRRSLAGPLGTLLKAAGGPTLEGADAVVPVPLHPWKRLRRGFNQASDLARQLERPVVHALWRRSATRAQAGLTPGERRRNVRAAFAPSPWLTRRARERAVRGRVVVLVDDIMTTGATLDACALQLLRLGAAEVRALAVARAVRPGRATNQ